MWWWTYRNRAKEAKFFFFFQFTSESTLNEWVTWTSIRRSTEQEHHSWELTGKVAWTRSPGHQSSTSYKSGRQRSLIRKRLNHSLLLLHDQKQHAISQRWQNERKQKKGAKKEEERNLVSVIQDHHGFSSPPLTHPPFPSSPSANCPLLRRKASSPGTGTHCCRMLYHLWRKERQKKEQLYHNRTVMT